MGPEVPRVGRRLAAIFAADVAGYSRLMGQDEVGTLRALSAARATIGCLITENGGRLVNAVGDSVLAEFPSAIDAVTCAIAVQEKLAEADAVPGEGPPLPFRIAVHVGDVLPSGTDILGDGINVCARLQEVAEPRGICISGAAHQYVRKSVSVAFEDLGERTLKNIDEPVRVFALRPLQGAAYSPPQPPAPATVNSIAVLPFVNMSGDAGQEFFSDGITEEITAALAKVADLRVVGRTSAFQFKGRNQDLRSIGQALSATHLIEGSVRKAGDRVRITAQLIRAHDGTHLWSEKYDRNLTDIFAVQEDIAQAITTSLRVPLGLPGGGNLVRNRTRDLDSYQDYLRARALYRSRRPAEAKTILDLVVARDPGFAPAWALSARNHSTVPNYSATTRSGTIEEARTLVLSSFDSSEKAARKAIELDPQHAGGYSAFGTVELLRGHFGVAEDLLKALTLDANDPDGLMFYGQLLGTVGRLNEALRVMEQLKSLEPFVPVYNIVMVEVMQAAGQTAATIPILEALPHNPALSLLRNTALAAAYAEAGRYAEAADTLLAIQTTLVSQNSIEAAARLIRQTAAKTAAPLTLPVLQGELNFVYAHVGALDRILDFPERNLKIGINSIINANHQLWPPERAPVRKTERFKDYVRNAGFVDYWRERGWPDLCRPIGASDFVCD